ncbi:Uncharacterised protein [Mycobacteroides abscessus subsp. abscessus]|nr:Uncharacterised protein [Mycobacteroides abscessus subsp. abscessus]
MGVNGWKPEVFASDEDEDVVAVGSGELDDAPEGSVFCDWHPIARPSTASASAPACLFISLPRTERIVELIEIVFFEIAGCQ